MGEAFFVYLLRRVPTTRTMCLCWFDELNLRVELLNWLFGNCSSSLYTVVSSFVNSISYHFLFFPFFLFIFFFHFFFTHFYIYIFFSIFSFFPLFFSFFPPSITIPLFLTPFFSPFPPLSFSPYYPPPPPSPQAWHVLHHVEGLLCQAPPL